MRDLYLHEQAFLLALRREGTVHAAAWIDDALGAALLGELLLDGALRPVVEQGSTYIEAVRAPAADDALLRRCHALVVAEGARRWTPAEWVQDFAHRSFTRTLTAAGLIGLGVLGCDEETVLWLFKRPIYPEVDPEPEARLVTHLREVLRSDEPVDPRTTVLVALAHRTGLLEANLDAAELAERTPRIEAIIAGDATGHVTGDALQESLDAVSISTMAAVQAGVFAGAILPTIRG